MKYILVKSRHIHPQLINAEPMFDSLDNSRLFDFDYHKKIIHEKLKNHTGELVLYVTGLTPLLISVINYCRLFNISLLLYHFDTSVNEYVPQSIV